MRVHLLLMAKTPVPGRVKTRLCPPYTPQQAAGIAAAALADTVDTLTATPAEARTLVIDGDLPAPAGWGRMAQRGDELAERLAAAFADTAMPGVASVLVGMDTPQITRALIEEAVHHLAAGDTDAVLGPAEDGGWWALGLRNPVHAEALRYVPMSTSATAASTMAALKARGCTVAMLPVLRDVDTGADVGPVAAKCAPGSRFVAVTS